MTPTESRLKEEECSSSDDSYSYTVTGRYMFTTEYNITTTPNRKRKTGRNCEKSRKRRKIGLSFLQKPGLRDCWNPNGNGETEVTEVLYHSSFTEFISRNRKIGGSSGGQAVGGHNMPAAAAAAAAGREADRMHVPVMRSAI